jgi:hypothetical protein
VLRGIDTFESVKGATVESGSQGLVLIPDKEVKTIELVLTKIIAN